MTKFGAVFWDTWECWVLEHLSRRTMRIPQRMGPMGEVLGTHDDGQEVDSRQLLDVHHQRWHHHQLGALVHLGHHQHREHYHQKHISGQHHHQGQTHLQHHQECSQVLQVLHAVDAGEYQPHGSCFTASGQMCGAVVSKTPWALGSITSWSSTGRYTTSL